MHRNNVRRRRKLESNASETVRIASIAQKGMSTGRSSYVEMRAIARQTGQNIHSKVHAIMGSVKAARADPVLQALIAGTADGYSDVLTPNGTIRQDKLDGLLAIDAEIATCLSIIESQLKEGKTDAIKTLEELIKERKKFVDDLRA
ncbi:MAG: hypothetical protein ABI347_10960 [Nitrososphaera sp.]